jgi:hypothetical protein
VLRPPEGVQLLQDAELRSEPDFAREPLGGEPLGHTNTL